MSISEPEILAFPGTPTVVVRGENVAIADLGKFMDESFTVLGEAVRDAKFRPAGPAFSRYDEPVGRLVTLEVGFPVEERLPEVLKRGDVVVFGSQLPAGTIAVTKYRGGYGGLSEAWEEFIKQVEDRGYETGTPFWEAYDVAPLPGMLEEKLETGLAVPVKRTR